MSCSSPPAQRHAQAVCEVRRLGGFFVASRANYLVSFRRAAGPSAGVAGTAVGRTPSAIPCGPGELVPRRVEPCRSWGALRGFPRVRKRGFPTNESERTIGPGPQAAAPRGCLMGCGAHRPARSGSAARDGAVFAGPCIASMRVTTCLVAGRACRHACKMISAL